MGKKFLLVPHPFSLLLEVAYGIYRHVGYVVNSESRQRNWCFLLCFCLMFYSWEVNVHLIQIVVLVWSPSFGMSVTKYNAQRKRNEIGPSVRLCANASVRKRFFLFSCMKLAESKRLKGMHPDVFLEKTDRFQKIWKRFKIVPKSTLWLLSHSKIFSDSLYRG